MNKGLLIAGNWKMHKTAAESVEFVRELEIRLENSSIEEGVEVLVFPPFTSLAAVRECASRVKVGAQNVAAEEQGAFTGEISPLMLNGVVDYVMIGHSERRHIFGETDIQINRKVTLALKYGFTPVLCVGETLEERERGKTMDRINSQLDKGLADLSPENVQRIVIAYEPVWAIGTGKTATPGQAQEVHAAIREVLKKKSLDANKIFILYGGSVKPDNSGSLMGQSDIDGALVGGASLKVESFFDIITNSSNPVHR
jgi:triosephosphate isomerase